MNHPSPGTALRQALNERFWTQTELARRTGYSKSTISRVLSDRAPISVKLDLDLSITTNFHVHEPDAAAVRRAIESLPDDPA